jgi:hypothetical protein
LQWAVVVGEWIGIECEWQAFWSYKYKEGIKRKAAQGRMVKRSCFQRIDL